jgi:hypothetical protein
LAVSDDNAIYTSPTGDVWTVRTPAAIVPQSCCAIKSDGTTFSGSAGETLLIASSNAVEKSTDAGVTWVAAAAIPDAGSIVVSNFRGWLAALPIDNTVVPFFLAQVGNDVNRVWRLYRGTSTASSWTAVSDLPTDGMPPANAMEGAPVRLLADPSTGALLAVVADSTGSSGIWLSLDYGRSWCSFALLKVGCVRASVAMTGGRVFVSEAGEAGIRMSGPIPTAVDA